MPGVKERAGIRYCWYWWPNRLISPASEWRLRRHSFGSCALGDLLGMDFRLAESHKRYACHDLLLKHKQALFDHLVGRWRDLFNASFEVLLYDLTSTYIESNAPKMKITSGASATAATSTRTVCRW